jgi:hypothetical protein
MKMSMTTRKNASVKALQSYLAQAKKQNAQALLEWLIACNTNAKRGATFDQHDILALYDHNGDAEGASKACHLYDHKGNRFQYIVVKLHQIDGWMPNVGMEHKKCTGNQMVDEINCWNEFAERPESDLLCPILKYFTSKSDKVSPTSETMVRNVIIIAQRAEKVGNASYACQKAEEMNAEKGYKGESAERRFRKLETFSKAMGWRDAMRNRGNSGVVFDYAKGCYKAVFIDYAL